VAEKIAEYNLLALPVIDDLGDILGIVTVDDAMNCYFQRTGDKDYRNLWLRPIC